MRYDVHQRARYLIEEALIAALSASDQRWLGEHVSTCGDCAGYSRTTSEMLQGLRSLSYHVDPAMNRRVQAAVLSPKGGVSRAWRRALAAAALIVLATPAVYRSLGDRQWHAPSVDDQALMDSIAVKLSRAIPQALEPLRQPASSEAASR